MPSPPDRSSSNSAAGYVPGTPWSSGDWTGSAGPSPISVGLIAELGEQQIGFVSLTEAIDTTTPAGRLLFGVMASLAQFERDVIRERTTAGLAAAKARGRVGGRPTIMTPDNLAVARQMLADGKPKAVVAKTIGVSRPHAVRLSRSAVIATGMS